MLRRPGRRVRRKTRIRKVWLLDAADEIAESAPNERVNLDALKRPKLGRTWRHQGSEASAKTFILYELCSSLPWGKGRLIDIAPQPWYS
jgi:hypothetical protein